MGYLEMLRGKRDMRGKVAEVGDTALTALTAQNQDTPEREGEDIIAALRDRGIRVRLVGGGLMVGPKGLLDEADRFLLAEHRDAIVAALVAEQRVVVQLPGCPGGHRDGYDLVAGQRVCATCGATW